MKWLILTLVMIPVVVVLIGYALPKEHVASRKVVVRASPEDVFALIAGPSVWRGMKYEQVVAPLPFETGTICGTGPLAPPESGSTPPSGMR